MTYETLPLAATCAVTGVATNGEHLYPTNLTPDFELPVLLAQQPTDLPDPCEWIKWGRLRRSAEAQAWHYYCSDSKFETTLRNPDQLVKTGAKFAIEPNISTFEGDPLPVVLANLFRKRSVTRYWQDHGVQVAIDLNVCGLTREHLLEGVPTDHTFFGTKYQKTDLFGEPVGIDGLVEDYCLASDHVDAGLPLTFVVYGGGKKIQEFCNEQGWFWLPNATAGNR